MDVSRAWSLAISGGYDGRSLVWDINRLCFVTQLRRHPGPLVAVAVNHASGELCTACAQGVWCHDINGVAVAYVPHLAAAGSSICSLTMTQGPEWMDANLVVTGHRDGAIRCWGIADSGASTPRSPGSPRSPRNTRSRGLSRAALNLAASDPAGGVLGAGLALLRQQGEQVTGMPPKRRSEPLLSMEEDGDDDAPSAAVKLDLHRTRSEPDLASRSPTHSEQAAGQHRVVVDEVDVSLAEAVYDEQAGAMPATSESTIALELVLRRELSGHDAAVTSLFVTKDQKRLLSSDRSGSIWSWAVD